MSVNLNFSNGFEYYENEIIKNNKNKEITDNENNINIIFKDKIQKVSIPNQAPVIPKAKKLAEEDAFKNLFDFRDDAERADFFS